MKTNQTDEWSIERPDGGGTSRGDRLLERWRRVELWVGLALVAGGFVAVGLGWYDASGTADVRRQMQALISGGFGGLAAVVLGAAVLQAHVQSRGTRRLAEKFDGVADALLELAAMPSHAEAAGPNGEAPTQEVPLVQPVLASNASYHEPGCDLAASRSSLRELPKAQAMAEGLRPCAVCQPTEEGAVT